jgi:hypothetical protein
MGITKAESEKRDKVLAHRRQRRAEVITLRKAGEVWSVATVGQPRFDPRRWPQLMRT